MRIDLFFPFSTGCYEIETSEFIVRQVRTLRGLQCGWLTYF